MNNWRALSLVVRRRRMTEALLHKMMMASAVNAPTTMMRL